MCCCTAAGYVERSVKSFFRQLLEYKRSFAVIRHGYIVFYGSTESRVPSGTIEIAAVVSINTIEDEPNVLELSLAEKAFRIKFSTPGELCVAIYACHVRFRCFLMR